MTEILGLDVGTLASGRRPPLQSPHIEAGREVFRLELPTVPGCAAASKFDPTSEISRFMTTILCDAHPKV
jgi:hypothetical protein